MALWVVVCERLQVKVEELREPCSVGLVLLRGDPRRRVPLVGAGAPLVVAVAGCLVLCLLDGSVPFGLRVLLVHVDPPRHLLPSFILRLGHAFDVKDVLYRCFEAFAPHAVLASPFVLSVVPPTACWCSAAGAGAVCVTCGCVSRLLRLLLWWLLCVCGCPLTACWCSAAGAGAVCVTCGCVSRLLGLLLWWLLCVCAAFGCLAAWLRLLLGRGWVPPPRLLCWLLGLWGTVGPPMHRWQGRWLVEWRSTPCWCPCGGASEVCIRWRLRSPCWSWLVVAAAVVVVVGVVGVAARLRSVWRQRLLLPLLGVLAGLRLPSHCR